MLAFQDELNKIKELEVRFAVYREITVKCCDFLIEGNLRNDDGNASENVILSIKIHIIQTISRLFQLTQLSWT